MSFVGIDKAQILSGVITKIELKLGSGSFLSVGRFTVSNFDVTGLAEPTDPSDTMDVYALRYSLSFVVLQTDKTDELAQIATGSTSFNNDAQVKLTYVGGRVVTLGAATGYPLRLQYTYTGYNEEGAQALIITAENTEPISNFLAKVA